MLLLGKVIWMRERMWRRGRANMCVTLVCSRCLRKTPYKDGHVMNPYSRDAERMGERAEILGLLRFDHIDEGDQSVLTSIVEFTLLARESFILSSQCGCVVDGWFYCCCSATLPAVFAPSIVEILLVSTQNLCRRSTSPVDCLSCCFCLVVFPCCSHGLDLACSSIVWRCASLDVRWCNGGFTRRSLC